ncbi:hypothetical protein HU200_015329 [Digitaria exilis]|uniref:Uncharacterized protein n=1 Tax=Digitaria exilis TaxID=1010633 RepID=A0A835FAK2_9POAL|nr:hypothetical protein HU200_015329 [Digitaria exilis]
MVLLLIASCITIVVFIVWKIRRKQSFIFPSPVHSVRHVGFVLEKIQWDVSLQPLQMIIQSRQQFGSCIPREIVIVACRSLWCHRNSIVFDGQSVLRSLESPFVEDTKKGFS